MLSKKCNRCGQIKNMKHFSKNKSRKDGHNGFCKICMNSYRRNNLKKYKKYNLLYKKNNAKTIKIKRMIYLNKSTIKKKVSKQKRIVKLRLRYGITVDDYNKMLISQNYRCAICGEKQLNNKKLAVDHCHKTGKVRGLLCRNCNIGIGMLNDNPESLLKAYKYIKHYGK